MVNVCCLAKFSSTLPSSDFVVSRFVCNPAIPVETLFKSFLVSFCCDSIIWILESVFPILLSNADNCWLILFTSVKVVSTFSFKLDTSVSNVSVLEEIVKWELNSVSVDSSSRMSIQVSVSKSQ